MITIILSWISQLLILKTFGSIFSKYFKNLSKDWFDELIAGYCLLSFLVVIISLFVPLNAWFHLALLIFSIFYCPFLKMFKLKFSNSIFLISIAVFVLMLAIQHPNHGDSSFYHAQALQWVEKYRAIPGLGNLFSRIAFDSSFFNVQSVFSFYPFSSINSRFLNSFIVLCWYLFLFQKSVNKTEKNEVRLLASAFAFASFAITRGWVSTIAPDVAVGIFILIILYKILSQILFDEPIQTGFVIIIFFTAITIKISSLLIFPLVLIYLLRKNQTLDTVKKLSIFSIILIPWIVRNIIISGYFIYPYFPNILWQPDWAIPSFMAQMEKNWIESWAKLPEKSVQYVLHLKLTEWVPLWFSRLNIINKLTVLATAISIFCVVIKSLINLIKNRKLDKLQLFAISWCIIILIWFIKTPNLRFGVGFILPFIIFTMFFLAKNQIKFLYNYLNYFKPLFLISLIIITFYINFKEKTKVWSYFIFPEPYPYIQTQTYKIGNLNVNVAPLDESCWDAPIPCINDYMVNQNIEMRGHGIKEGFRYKK